jgi:hypothetical protein
VSAQKQQSISPKSVYDQDGITVLSPNQPGWVLVQASKSETVFEKRATDEVLSAHVKTLTHKIFDNRKELLASLETLKKEELSRHKMVSVHFNNVRFKGSECLQYDGIFRVDAGSTPDFGYFNVTGYLCAHPKTNGLVVQMEFSSESNARGFSENLISVSEEFFEKVALSRIGSQ